MIKSVLSLPRNQEGVATLVLVVPIALLAAAIVSANIPTTRDYPITQASVLGDDEEDNSGEQDEIQKQLEEQQRESQKKLEEQQKEAAKSLLSGSPKPSGFSPNSGSTRNKTKIEGLKKETEIETATGQKIKTKVEDDGTTKVEVEQGGLKVKYIFENGQFKLKVENEDGEDTELGTEDLAEIESELENELESDGIEIATGSGKPILRRNNVAAVIDFPLSVDVATNQLIVTTPAGRKIVTVLPDQAVQNLLSVGIINRVDTSSNDATPSAALTGDIKLEVRNNEIVYKINGIKTHNLLGFIPVPTPTTVFVSAETGNPVAQNQSLLTNLIDFLSP